MKCSLVLLLAGALVPIGCSGSHEDAAARESANPHRVADVRSHDPEAPPANRPSSTPEAGPRPTRWLAATDGGASLALADESGGCVAKVPLPSGELLRDLVADSKNDRALVFALDEDNGDGELLTIDVGDDSLGAPTRLAWIDGDARFATDGTVLLMFERSYGDAWKRLDSSGAALPRWPSPPPLATVSSRHGIEVLFEGDGGEPKLADVSANGAWPPSSRAIGSATPTARIIGDTSGTPWLFDSKEGELVVRRGAPFEALRALGVDIGDGVLEEAIETDEGRIALLVSGTDQLVTASLTDDGPQNVEVIEIGAPIAAGDVWPIESIARIAPGIIAVATASGVVSFRGTARISSFDGASFSGPIASWP